MRRAGSRRWRCATAPRSRATPSRPAARRRAWCSTPDRTALAGDGRDAVPVTVSAVDAQGRPVPTANVHVRFEIEGAGAIIGVGNGDPNSHEPEKATERKLLQRPGAGDRAGAGATAAAR